MTIVCPRCATVNSTWDKRCEACWLPFDAALRAKSQAFGERSASSADTDEKRQSASEPHSANEAHPPLAGLLGLEVEHARALAAAGIHTLEHVAESMPEKIAHALAACTHIDPEALIARAQKLLHPGEYAGVKKPDPQPPAKEPNATEWWKST